MRNIWTITRKELNAYFRSPLAYIVLAVFAIIFGYFFVSILSRQTVVGAIAWHSTPERK